MILSSPFQLRIFHDSVIQQLPLETQWKIFLSRFYRGGKTQKLNCEVVFGFETNQDKSGVYSPVWRWWKHRFVLKTEPVLVVILPTVATGAQRSSRG